MSFTHYEIQAIETMLPSMGEYVATAGIMDKPFAQCSRDEILGLFATTVKTFRDQFGKVVQEADIPY